MLQLDIFGNFFGQFGYSIPRLDMHHIVLALSVVGRSLHCTCHTLLHPLRYDKYLRRRADSCPYLLGAGVFPVRTVDILDERRSILVRMPFPRYG